MTSIRDNVKILVEHAEKLSETAGPASAAFHRLHMEEIRKIEKDIRASDKPDEYLAALRKHLDHSSHTVRERVAYILGELVLLHPTSKEVDHCVSKLIECTGDNLCFQPVNTAGREIINALGKSGRAKAESTLLQFFGNSTTQSIRQNILVALGKTGGSQTVYFLSDLIKRRKLSIPDTIHSLWALGKLGGVQNTSRDGFPLARALFEQPLKRILEIIQGNVIHPTVHYLAIYAVGEICDQRDTSGLKDSIQDLTLRKADATVSSIRSRQKDIRRSIQNHQKFCAKADLHTKNLIDIGEKVALKMIRGQKLDLEGERILFAVRILFDATPSPDTRQELPDALMTTIEIDMQSAGQGMGLVKPFRIPTPSLKETPFERVGDATIGMSTVPKGIAPTPAEKPKPAEGGISQEYTRPKQPGLLKNEEEIKDEIEHQSNLRKELLRRFRALELESARKGIDTPPQTLTQIEDIRKQINEIDKRIVTLTQELENIEHLED